MNERVAVLILYLLQHYIHCALGANVTHIGSKYQYVECLAGNVTNSATLAQEITDCLATPVNALYLNVYLNPHSREYSLWAFSFHSYFVVVDATKADVNFLSFSTLSLNLCNLRVSFKNYCNTSDYGFNGTERDLVGTFLFNQYIVNAHESIQLGIINPSSSDSDTSSDSPSNSSTTNQQGRVKVMTVEQSALLCQLSSPNSRSSVLSPSYCCKNDLHEPGFGGGNVTVYPLRCSIQNSSSKKPLNYLTTALILSGVLTLILVSSNIEYAVPVVYTWWDPVFNADTTVPLFWGKPGQQRLCTHQIEYTIAYILKFIILSSPIIWGSISNFVVRSLSLLVTAVVLGVTLFWILYVTLNEHTQAYILKNIPQPLYAATLLRKSFISDSKNSSRRRAVLFMLYLVPSLCVVLYVYLLVLWSTIIIFFVVCGIAANTNAAISTVSLFVALFIMIKTEHSILRRPVMRVKVLLMNKEELRGMTWGHVYTLLEKLHWLPMNIVKRRFPLYVSVFSVLGLIYFALKMFSDNKQLMSNVIFQSVMMLVVGYIPSLLDREDYDEYTMLEVYKEIGLKEIESELKAKKFTKHNQTRGRRIQGDGGEEGEVMEEGDQLLVNY